MSHSLDTSHQHALSGTSSSAHGHGHDGTPIVPDLLHDAVVAASTAGDDGQQHVHHHDHAHGMHDNVDGVDDVGAGIDVHDPDLDKDWVTMENPYLNADDFYAAQATNHTQDERTVGHAHGMEHGHVDVGGTDHDHDHEHEHAARAALADYTHAAQQATAGVPVGVNSDALGHFAQHLQMQQQRQHPQQQHQHQHHAGLGVGVGVGNIGRPMGSTSAIPLTANLPLGMQAPQGLKRSRSPSLGTGTSSMGVGVGHVGDGTHMPPAGLDMRMGDSVDPSLGGVGVGVGVGLDGRNMDNIATSVSAGVGETGESSGTHHADISTDADDAGAEPTTAEGGTEPENGIPIEADPEAENSTEPPQKRKRGPRAMRNKPPMQYWTDPSIAHLNLPATYEGRAIEYSRDEEGIVGPVFVHPAPGTVQACIRCHTIKRKCEALEFDNDTQVWTKAKCSGCEKSGIPCVFELAAASSGYVFSALEMKGTERLEKRCQGVLGAICRGC